MNIGAIVVCGGRSSRMGRSKAWLEFGPERMLQRVVRLVSLAANPIVVVAAPGQDLPPLPEGILVVHDPIEGRGPLQGIATGLDALPPETTFAYATATDVPFLIPGWIDRLASMIGDDDLAIPEAEGYLQPLAALYRISTVRPAIRALLDADRLRPVYLREAVRTRVVGVDELREVDPDLTTLRNLNTPDDYRDALRRAGFPADPGDPSLS